MTGKEFVVYFRWIYLLTTLSQLYLYAENFSSSINFTNSIIVKSTLPIRKFYANSIRVVGINIMVQYIRKSYYVIQHKFQNCISLFNTKQIFNK